ncbi:CHAT domain-containing protein [Cellulomonas sp. PhB143]|uniref:CHAT domain-containing protein n=1 Tax=Cellulomonas sp. PhB143 TaxID=2485186 RepID=UPI000F47C4DF|nr:CHAT domain-containing protein [Cellulomonas sp. PhB143]ROS76768.1 CHAT domain-containing protein [Cellulomonas sp. PhB143]
MATTLERVRTLYERAHDVDAAGRPAAAARAYRAAGAALDDVVASAGATDAAEAQRLRVRILLGVAYVRYELGGGLAGALEVLDQARVAARDDARLRMATLAQEGLLRLRAGDVGAAIAAFDEAVPDAAEVTRDAAVILLNRGVLRMETGDLARAEADLRGCADRAERIDERIVRSKALHNLGFLEYLRGELPSALRSMDEAAQVVTERPDAVAQLDRARVLYEAGLLTEAVDRLDDAAAILRANGASVDLAQARLDGARCALELGRPDRALELAHAARDGFRRQGNEPWQLRAELVVHQSRFSALGLTASAARYATAGRHAAGLARRAGEHGGLASSVVAPALLLQAESLARSGNAREAAEVLGRADVSGRGVPLSLRIQHEAVCALVHFAAADRRRGLAAVRRGQRMLATQRARLGTTDSVTAAAVHGVRLGNIDVAAGLGTGRADVAFDAVERGRATFAGAGRVSAPDDAGPAAALTRARELIERARGLGVSGTSAAEREDLLRRARALQDEVRARSWRTDGASRVPVPMTARGLRAVLDEDTTVVSLVEADGRLVALRVERGGARRVDLGPLDLLLEDVRRARADLLALSAGTAPAALLASVRASARRTLDRLDRAVLAPLRVEGRLHVVARRHLLTVPWGMLTSRAGRATSVDSWVAVRPRTAVRGRPASAAVIAGPGLDHADAEVAAVAAVWPGARVLAGEDATCDAARALVSGTDVVHLAAHGTHEPDNPLFSSVRLADGPLFAHELETADLEGATVVLSACEVGRTTTRAGGEPLGLTSVLLRHGVRAVVAAVAPLRDDLAAAVMPVLHAHLRAGTAPAGALAAAVASVDEPVPLVAFGPLEVGPAARD